MEGRGKARGKSLIHKGMEQTAKRGGVEKEEWKEGERKDERKGEEEEVM